jgi:hypothetical protein
VSVPIPCHECRNLIYVEVPKAGCTSVKQLFAELDGKLDGSSYEHEEFHQWFGYIWCTDIDTLHGWFALPWASRFRFTLVRHPLRRFRSLYQDYRMRFDYGEMGIDGFALEVLPVLIGDGDAHAAPQVAFVGTDLSLFDFVGHTEDMPKLSAALSDALGEIVEVPWLHVSTKTQERLSTEAEAFVRGIYHEDFDALGYS